MPSITEHLPVFSPPPEGEGLVLNRYEVAFIQTVIKDQLKKAQEYIAANPELGIFEEMVIDNRDTWEGLDQKFQAFRDQIRKGG